MLNCPTNQIIHSATGYFAYNVSQVFFVYKLWIWSHYLSARYLLFVSLVLNATLRQRNLLGMFRRENYVMDFISAMTTWENKPINGMKVGLLKNRTILFSSSDLNLPICKHIQVLICFPHPMQLGCFPALHRKANWQEEKDSGKEVQRFFTERKALQGSW